MRNFGQTALIACLLLTGFGFTKSPAQRPKGPILPTTEIQLPVTVEKQQPVSRFKKNSFRVYENGVRQKILSLTTDKANPPVYAGLIMDTSSSTGNKLEFYREAVTNFLYTTVYLRKHKAAFMTFDSEIVLRQDFTDKIDLLQRAVDKVKKTGSKAALYDAIWIFADEKFRNVPGRRVMVIVTDSDDIFSRVGLNDAIDIAQRTQTTIFTISTRTGFLGNSPRVDFQGDLPLTALSEQTGGRLFYATDTLSLERALKLITDELKYQYVLTYRPKNQKQDGRARTIEVRLKNKKDAAKYRLRTRKSYRMLTEPLTSTRRATMRPETASKRLSGVAAPHFYRPL